MKKILFALLLLSSSAFADPLTLWPATYGGTLEPVCRKIMEAYESTYREPTQVMSRPGLDGIIATRDMLESRVPERLLCHGSSALVQNQFVHADIDHATAKLSLLIKFAESPEVWYVPNSGPARGTLADTMSYFRSLNRPINVGTYMGNQKVLVAYLAHRYDVPLTAIPYKRAQDFWPGLSDGSIDLAMDAGSGAAVARKGQFRMIGYHGPGVSQLSDIPNFAKENTDLKDFVLWGGALSMPVDTPADVQKRVADRIEFILNTNKEIQQLATDTYMPITIVRGHEAQRQVESQVRVTQRYWK
jgi:tripartite-type tricarboxylate transporter receptor subunit TctC